MWLIVAKDLTIERSTREISTTSTFFALLVAITASMAMHGAGDSEALVAPGVLWIAIVFAAFLAIGKTWQRERDNQALEGLLSSPIPRSALLAGKALGLLLFLVIVEAVVLPLTAMLFSVDLWRALPKVLLISSLALPGLSITGSMFGAMTVRTQARDMVLATVLLPLLLPVLLAAVAATREAFAGASFGELWDYLLIIMVFDFLFSAGSFAIFGALLDE